MDQSCQVSAAILTELAGHLQICLPSSGSRRDLKAEKIHISGRGERRIRNRLVSLNKKMEKLQKDGRMKEKGFMKAARITTVICTVQSQKIQ